MCGSAAATGSPFRSQTSRWLSDGGAQLDEHLARARARDRARPRSGEPRGRPSSWMRIAFTRPIVRGAGISRRSAVTMGTMITADVQRLGAELGLDAVGVARAEAYEGTERHIRERRARGLFGRLRLHDRRTPRSRAIPRRCSTARAASSRRRSATTLPEPERPAGHGRLPRYAWHDGYAELREKLDALGRALGAPYRVLVDANQHVDREAAARSGVGFYGKNTMLITRRHGSWVVLGTLVTAAELEPTPPLADGCGSCTRCIDACPTGALDEPGVLDATTVPLVLDAGAGADPGAVPRAARRAGLRLRHLPGRLPVEPRRRGAARRARARRRRAHVDLVGWLDGEPRSRRRPARAALRARATTRAGCAGTRSSRSATREPATARRRRRCAGTPTATTSCSPSTPAGRSTGWRSDAAEGPRALDLAPPPDRVPVRPRRGRRSPSYPPGWEPWAWVTTGVFVVGSCAFFVLARSRARRAAPVRAEPRRADLRHGDRHRRT